MPAAQWPLRNDAPMVEIELSASGEHGQLRRLVADTGADTRQSVFQLILHENDCLQSGAILVAHVQLGGAYSGVFPVYVIDADRHQTFVLLTSDDFHRIEPFLGYSPDDSEWTDAKENRRRELIDKDIAGTITAEEQVELAALDRQRNAHYDKVAPRPIEGVRRLHQELLQKRDSE